MKKVDTNVSRREFLKRSAVVASVTGSTIVAIQSSTPNVKAGSEISEPIMPNDPVYTESTQTLTNKKISSLDNTLGFDDVFVKEFNTSGSDITSALNSAINFLNNSNYGGRILIPRGIWETNGGHEFKSSISIEGVGVNSDGPVIVGTEIKLKANQNNYVFRITTNTQHCSLKNLEINMANNSLASGLVMTNHHSGSIQGSSMYFTEVENVKFRYGMYGIKVDSKETGGASTNFECIMNRFERVSFLFCQTAFSCNSANGGYTFDTCYFSLPTPSGVALDCKWMGFMDLRNCLFIGNSPKTDNVPPSDPDQSTILKTFGAFVSICFYNCQDENIRYYYQNANNHHLVPIVFRNCAIQSTFKYTASGAVIFDSCRINVTDVSQNGTGAITRIEDSATGAADVYLKGATDLFKHAGSNLKFNNFVHPYSRLIYESNETGAIVVNPTPVYTGTYSINETRGVVNIESGTSKIIIVNNRVNTDALIFTQLRTYDPGGARIREVRCFPGYFEIYLNQNAATTLSVGFKVEGTNF